MVTITSKHILLLNILANCVCYLLVKNHLELPLLAGMLFELCCCFKKVSALSYSALVELHPDCVTQKYGHKDPPFNGSGLYVSVSELIYRVSQFQ